MSEVKSTSYTYSARDVEEAKRIRKEFIKGEPSEMDQLRKLQHDAETKARIPAITLGVISALVFGFGFCCTMVWTNLFIIGIVVGVVGLIGIALVYPLYKARLEKERKLVENEVRQLSDAVIGR